MTEACNACGAEIVFEAGKQSLTCPFCGAVNQVERPEEALETSFDHIVPIAVTPQELDNRLYAYMASGNFTPDDMIEASTITRRERYYVPAFAFKVDYEATWTASFGFNKQEPYTAHRSVTRNNQTYQEAYTAYRTVTDWRPVNGVEAGIFDVAGYGGTQLAGLPLAPADLVVHAVINGNPTEYNPSFITGFEIEGFSIPEKKVFESLKDEINTNIDNYVKKNAQGDKQRDWHWNARMSHNTTTYAVPICHGAFQYGDKEYNVWVGGHDVETIRADELPVDKDKKKAANIGFVPGSLGLVTIIGSAYYWSFVGSSLITTVVALGYGYMRRKALIDYSKSIRSSLLTQMQASSQVIANLSNEEQAKVANAFQRPERPFFAKTHKDKIILPALAAFAFFGAVVPNAVLNPMAIGQRAIARQASDQAEQEQRNATARVAQDEVDRKAAEEQASTRAQEEAAAALKAEAEKVAQTEAAAQKAEAEKVALAEASNASAQSLPTQPASPNQNPNTASTAQLAIAPTATSGQIAISAGFLVVSPEESRQLLTAMLQQATSAFKVSEIKGKIEAFPKPITGDRKAARKLNDQGLVALKSDDFAQALTVLKNAVATDPADVEILNNYVYTLIKAKRLQDAESEAGRLLTISPGRSSAWANLAEVYALKNKNEEAVAALVLAFQFSSNKDRTVTFLNDRASDTNSPLQATAKKAIEVIQKM